MIDNCDKCDVAIFSPPYPNSFDYTDIYNLELWMLGYLRTWDCNTTLRNRTFRSHVQVKRDFFSEDLPSRELKRVHDRLLARKTRLWNANIPDMVVGYFDDMGTVLLKLKKKLSPKGRAFLVVGNSKYAGVTVDTPKIIEELAPVAGFKSIQIQRIRAMRSSAQQGGSADLNESLIVMS
jgi:hypothetical protein